MKSIIAELLTPVEWTKGLIGTVLTGRNVRTGASVQRSWMELGVAGVSVDEIHCACGQNARNELVRISDGFTIGENQNAAFLGKAVTVVLISLSNEPFACRASSRGGKPLIESNGKAKLATNTSSSVKLTYLQRI
jgi:hypothetical protein